MFRSRTTIFAVAVVILQASMSTTAFAPPSVRRITKQRSCLAPIFMTDAADAASTDESAPLTTSTSLEEKLRSWEASEEEVRAATLGGIVPGSGGERSNDAFDVGLYIAFPIMVLGCLAFAFFPFLVQ